MDLKSKIRVIEGFPKEGISFKDITTLISDGEAFREAVILLMKIFKIKIIPIFYGQHPGGL